MLYVMVGHQGWLQIILIAYFGASKHASWDYANGPIIYTTIRERELSIFGRNFIIWSWYPKWIKQRRRSGISELNWKRFIYMKIYYGANAARFCWLEKVTRTPFVSIRMLQPISR